MVPRFTDATVAAAARRLYAGMAPCIATVECPAGMAGPATARGDDVTTALAMATPELYWVKFT